VTSRSPGVPDDARGTHVDPDRGPSPSELADLVGRLRADSCATLAQLTDAELATPALPGWSVGDVYRHLASSDRSSVTGKLLVHLLPGRAAEELEPVNDELVEQLRGRPRESSSASSRSGGAGSCACCGPCRAPSRRCGCRARSARSR
jgi:hypothetical protein